jgi:hypothetical protein
MRKKNKEGRKEEKGYLGSINASRISRSSPHPIETRVWRISSSIFSGVTFFAIFFDREKGSKKK